MQMEITQTQNHYIWATQTAINVESTYTQNAKHFIVWLKTNVAKNC